MRVVFVGAVLIFLLTLIPSSIALSWHYRKTKNFAEKSLIIPFLLLIWAILFGFYRLYTPSTTQSLKIGIAAIEMPGKKIFPNTIEAKNNILAAYAKSAGILAHQGAKIVLLPEEVMLLNQKDKNIFLRQFGAVAQQNNIFLIVGLRILTRRNGEKFYNSAWMFAPDGQLINSYNKQHPVPGFESNMIRGKKLAILRTKTMGTWGIGVCKDMDFLNPARENGAKGVNIIFAPALDFVVDAWVHGRIAIMRGVENNFAIARAGQSGLLTLTDSRGRIVASALTLNAKNQTLLTASLKIGEGRSIYSKFGDWFAWLCLIIFGIISAAAFNKGTTECLDSN